MPSDGGMIRHERAGGPRRTKPEDRRHKGHHVIQSDALLAAYYDLRAPEMEEAYHLPERAADMIYLQDELPRLVAGRDVLEIACGPGFWTRVMAATARSVTATDVSERMLALARRRSYGNGHVKLLHHDAWNLGRLAGRFDAAAALFWWSHIPHYRIRTFVRELNSALDPGSPVVLVDNLPTDCRVMPPVGFDADGNSYQRRAVRSGEQFDIIKNYPSREDLLTALDGLTERVSYRALRCLWMLRYRTPGQPSTAE